MPELDELREQLAVAEASLTDLRADKSPDATLSWAHADMLVWKDLRVRKLRRQIAALEAKEKE